MVTTPSVYKDNSNTLKNNQQNIINQLFKNII